jgi:iron-sulfur cluster repair protein YtfE (RIC family)
MIKLIEELKEEHTGIINLFANVDRMGIHAQEGRDCLTSCKHKLLDHLKKEDEDFYPRLLEKEQLPEHTTSLINKYKKEFQEVTKEAVIFFDKYSIEGGGIEFLQDFSHFKSVLEDRIKREEEILFPEILKFYQANQ